MKEPHIVVATSDLHVDGAGEISLEYALREHPNLKEFTLVGDRSIDPDFSSTDGRNLLREAKIAAKEAGIDYNLAEQKVWNGPHRDALVQQWLDILLPTLKVHHLFEHTVVQGKIPIIPDNNGNDYDKDNRVVEAYKIRQQTTGQSPGITLLDIINSSLAFRIITSVESRIEGVTLQIDIPYIENKQDVTLEKYLYDIERILHADVSDIRQVVIKSHLNPDPELRKENRNLWYLTMYRLIKSYLPNAEVLHLFGHSHKIPAPYVFSDTGVLLVPIGYGAKEGIQRVAVMDYSNPAKRYYVDLRINPNQQIDIVTKQSF